MAADTTKIRFRRTRLTAGHRTRLLWNSRKLTDQWRTSDPLRQAGAVKRGEAAQQSARATTWGHAQRAIGRQDCQCSRQLGLFVAIYRGNVPVGYRRNLGLGAVSDRNPNLIENEMRSGRNYWFPRELIGRSGSVFFTTRKRIEEDLRPRTDALYDGVSPLIYDLGPNNTTD